MKFQRTLTLAMAATLTAVAMPAAITAEAAPSTPRPSGSAAAPSRTPSSQAVRPAMTIAVGTEDAACTLGFVFSDRRGKAKALTARHCGAVGEVVRSRSGSPVGVIDKLSTKPSDVAQISVRSNDPVYADVDGIGNVVGIISQKALEQARPLLCKKGATTMLTCGPLAEVKDDYFSFVGKADKGDSGAPVYVIQTDGTLLAAGILEGSDRQHPERIIATAVAPLARRWDLKVVR